MSAIVVLARKTDESASDVVGDGMVAQRLFIPRDSCGEHCSLVSLGQPTVQAGYMERLVRVMGAQSTEERVLALHTESAWRLTLWMFTGARWVTFAWRLAPWMQRVFQRGSAVQLLVASMLRLC